MGFRRFSLRGLEKVPDEWGIVSLCHNLLKLFRRCGSMKSLAASPAQPDCAGAGRGAGRVRGRGRVGDALRRAQQRCTRS